jgi:hypothetical protein
MENNTKTPGTAPQKPFVYAQMNEDKTIQFQMGGSDADALGLLEFSRLVMQKRILDHLKFGVEATTALADEASKNAKA